MKQTNINFATKLAFGMLCGVKFSASLCVLHFHVTNFVPNFSDQLSLKYIIYVIYTHTHTHNIYNTEHYFGKFSLFRHCILDFKHP
jgi:hypothetical protein